MVTYVSVIALFWVGKWEVLETPLEAPLETSWAEALLEEEQQLSWWCAEFVRFHFFSALATLFSLTTEIKDFICEKFVIAYPIVL